MYCVNFFRQVKVGVIEVLMNQRNKDFCSKYWHFLLIFDYIAFVQCNICNDIFCFDLMFRGWVTSYGRGRRGYQTLLDFQGLYEFLEGGGFEKKEMKDCFFLVVMLHMCKNCFLSFCWMILLSAS